MPQLSSRFLVTYTLAGRQIGKFQTFDGGGVGGDALIDRPPGAEYPRAFGGEKTLEPITITRSFDRKRETAELMGFLRAHTHEDDQAVVALWYLDENRNPYEKLGTWTGVQTSANNPTVDTNSQNDKTPLSITMQPSSVV